jgi:hypothetical protein
MHVVTVTRRTTAKPEVIWRLWADVPNRTRWDDALERITLQGPFQSGRRWNREVAGSTRAQVQGVGHRAAAGVHGPVFPASWRQDGLGAHHQRGGRRACCDVDISITGPTSPLLAPVLKSILRRELPSTLSKLIALAEQT